MSSTMMSEVSTGSTNTDVFHHTPDLLGQNEQMLNGIRVLTLHISDLYNAISSKQQQHFSVMEQLNKSLHSEHNQAMQISNLIDSTNKLTARVKILQAEKAVSVKDTERVKQELAESQERTRKAIQYLHEMVGLNQEQRLQFERQMEVFAALSRYNPPSTTATTPSTAVNATVIESIEIDHSPRKRKAMAVSRKEYSYSTESDSERTIKKRRP